jgi:hypothetical protein
MKRSFRAVMMIAALTFLGDDCGGTSLISDGNFESWRSDTDLGAWQVTAGHIEKVPTWSDADPGVEMKDDPTELTQNITPTSTSSCARVEILAKRERNATLTISAGGAELAIPELDWAKHVDYMQVAQKPAPRDPSSGIVIGPAAYQQVPLVIRKTGAGRVVLVKLSVVGTSSCRPDTSGNSSSSSN